MKRTMVKCPTCKAEGEWFAGRYGPFCSERCKLVDLGKWLNEEPRISEPLRPEHFRGYEDLPPGEYLDHPEEPASPKSLDKIESADKRHARDPGMS